MTDQPEVEKCPRCNGAGLVAASGSLPKWVRALNLSASEWAALKADPAEPYRVVWGRAVTTHHCHVTNPNPKRKTATVRCTDCDDLHQKGLPHQQARALCDEHLISTHVTGSQPCGHANCWGCKALARLQQAKEAADD